MRSAALAAPVRVWLAASVEDVGNNGVVMPVFMLDMRPVETANRDACRLAVVVVVVVAVGRVAEPSWTLEKLEQKMVDSLVAADEFCLTVSGC